MIEIYATIDGTERKLQYKEFTFSGGEEHVEVDVSGIDKYHITKLKFLARLNSSTDIMRLQLLDNALEWYCHQNVSRILYMPYVPYARQDRICHPGQAFSLRVFVDIINNMQFDEVSVVDPHSVVTVNAINNIKVVPQTEFVSYVASRLDHVDFIISPDKYTRDKTEAWLQKWNYIRRDQTRLIVSDKERDSNGNVIKTIIDTHECLTNKTCLIVDDICDGGRTFYEIAKILRERGSKQVYLFVTHGIISKGVEATGCDRVFTTDSIPEKDDGRIVVNRLYW